ncbi:MAG: aminotransferase class I/II-fold pyridoxal phosphate-dependent enzyme [Desulfosalsimonadaceae bacterium]
MRNGFLPFSKPSVSDADISAVVETLKSGWITSGPRASEFEMNFCEYTGAAASVALSSATAGMHLLLKALGIGPGDEVVTPSMTWVSTVNLIVLAGATPVFTDIDKHTMMVTPEMIERCITPRTRLIAPVHFAGASADMSPIRKIALDKNIFLAEDAAHALGTTYKGEKIGLRGTTIFSFHPIKNITTGEGGMFCSDDAILVERIKRLKFHGLGMDAFDRDTQGRAPQAEVIEPGFKYNMTDISAALGLSQLERVDAFNEKRRQLAQKYLDLLADVDEVIPLSAPLYDHRHAWHLFIIRLDIDKSGMGRDAFMKELKFRNIGTGLHFRAIHTQKYYRETMNIAPGVLPNTEWNSDRICSLPLFPNMTMEDVHDVVDAIKEVLKK